MAKKNNKAKKQKPQSRLQQRYHSVQRALSAAFKSEGIKPGKKFNSIASKIFKQTQGEKLSFLNKNIIVFYNDLIKKPRESKKKEKRESLFPKRFEFFNFVSEIQSPVFDGVEITVVFEDGKMNVSETGFRPDIEAWYIRELHSYLRENYNDSPPAEFVRESFEEEMSVVYRVKTGVSVKRKTFTRKGAPLAGKASSVALERERQKTLQEKVKAVRELKELGMSNEEIKKYLGI